VSSALLLQKTVDVLTEENELLREESRQLRSELENIGWRAPLELNLTPAEEVVLGCLLKRASATKSGLYMALYGSKVESDQATPKIVDVFICKLRKKLAPFGLEVGTDWGRGYFLTPDSKQKLQEMGGADHA
jgi:two-component system cell cycle response regulator CtrA